jgi:hypothetical protein
MSGKSKRKQQQRPQWQPISILATLGPYIDGMLEVAEEQYGNLQQARLRPYVLDGYTVGRVIKVFTDQKKDLPLFDEQLHRWKTGTISETQREEVERLAGQMAKLHQVIGQILELAKELSAGTIEKQLAKSDEQLGLEMITRMMQGKGML